MTVVHTYFSIIVDTQRGCHTLKHNYTGLSLGLCNKIYVFWKIVVKITRNKRIHV